MKHVEIGFSRIADFMTRDMITCSEEDIHAVANQMMIFGTGSLVIDYLPSNRLALVTERNLIRGFSAKRSVGFLVNVMQYGLEVGDPFQMLTPKPPG